MEDGDLLSNNPTIANLQESYPSGISEVPLK